MYITLITVLYAAKKCSPLPLYLLHLLSIDTFTVITFMNTAAAFQILFWPRVPFPAMR